jgi:hypothetical protein
MPAARRMDQLTPKRRPSAEPAVAELALGSGRHEGRASARRRSSRGRSWRSAAVVTGAELALGGSAGRPRPRVPLRAPSVVERRRGAEDQRQPVERPAAAITG